jgi:hypothetical protein
MNVLQVFYYGHYCITGNKSSVSFQMIPSCYMHAVGIELYFLIVSYYVQISLFQELEQ